MHAMLDIGVRFLEAFVACIRTDNAEGPIVDFLWKVNPKNNDNFFLVFGLDYMVPHPVSVLHSVYFHPFRSTEKKCNSK